MSEQEYNNIGKEFAGEHGTTMGQMFGKACLKKDNKAFAAFFKGDMVFKLGKQEVDLLKNKYTGSSNWDPSGKNRPMKDWLQVPSDFKEDWKGLAKQALSYVEEDK